MKKIIIVVFLLFNICTSAIYAGFNYQIDLLSFDPLHKEYFADRTRADSSLNYLFYIEGFPDRVLQDKFINNDVNDNQILVWEFDEVVKENGKMVNIKIGETLSLLRNTIEFDSPFSPISFDLSAQGVISEFLKGGFDDMFGYDGNYFYGASFKIGDFLSMRVGRHHYCTHYGDQVFKRVQRVYENNPSYDDFWITYKYVRMDDVAFGLSIEPTSNVRIYGELLYPPKNIKVLRPYMFAPNWVKVNDITVNPDYPDSYNARIVNVGFEISYPIFRNLGNTTIGYDLHLYEEGKVIYNHVSGGTYYFNDNASWEREHDLRIAQEISNVVSLECNYHNGRSPYNNFFFQHTEIFSIGLRVNPKTTVQLYN